MTEPDDIEAAVEALLRSATPADLPLARSLARRELEARRIAQDGCGDTLVACCLVLYRIGEPDDVRLIDEIKHLNFDCGCTIDRDFYQMRRTRAEMLAVAGTDATLAARIAEAFDAPNYDTPADFEASVRRYFGV